MTLIPSSSFLFQPSILAQVLVYLAMLGFPAMLMGSVITKWTFNDEIPGEVRETVTGAPATVHLVRGGGPERPPGVQPGRTSFRAEGWSSWLEYAPGVVAEPRGHFSLEGWVAVRAYPFESDAAIINQHAVPRGFFLGLNPYGRWNFSVGSGGGWHTAFAGPVLPRDRWVHLAATFASDGMRVYMDGNLVGENLFSNGGLDHADVPLLLGGHNVPGNIGAYPLGIFNGLLDEWRIHNRALPANEVRVLSEAFSPGAPFLVSAPDRYINDPHRPRFTPMPDTSWTNEPHGLTYWNGTYHIFYQANPNGNYLGTQQQWGHIWSNDLVTWNYATEAIWPGETYDRNGVWSGSTLNQGDRVAALYTSNRGGQSMSVAFSSDPLLMNWHKSGANPVIGEFPPDARPDLQGHRDPFVFSAHGDEYVIIGGGYPDGGRVFLYRAIDRDLTQWEYRGEMFSAPPEVAGTMWEMPQFFPLEQGKWCLMVNTLPDARSVYWIGRLEGDRFIAESPARLGDSARGIHGIPEQGRYFMLSPSVERLPDGRWWAVGVVIEDRAEVDRIHAGYANAFSLPLVYSLHPDGNRLRKQPLHELVNLRDEHYRVRNLDVVPGQQRHFEEFHATAFEMNMRVNMLDATSLVTRVRATTDNQEYTDIRYSRVSGNLLIERVRSSLSDRVGRWNVIGEHPLGDGEFLELRIFVDQSILTVFANERTVMTTRIYPTREDATSIDVRASGGTARILALDAWPLAGGGEIRRENEPTGWMIR